jgi:hypothetical protein
VWAGPEGNQWAVIARKALDVHGHMPPPEPGAPGLFSMADPARIRALVMEAGFSEPQIEEVTIEWRFEDFEAYWRFQTQLAGGVALTLSTLSGAEGAEVYATMEHEASAYRDAGGGYIFPGLVLNAVAS